MSCEVEGTATPTRDVVLTDHHEEVIDRLVKVRLLPERHRGLREGLRLIELREAREAVKLEGLREAAQVGFADLQAGGFLDFASFDELEDHLTRATRVG